MNAAPTPNARPAPAGLLAAGQTPAGPAPSAQTPSIQAAITKVEETVSRLPEDIQKGYREIVLAGSEVLFSPQTRGLVVQMLDLIKTPADVPARIAHGIGQLLSVVYREATSNGKAFSIPAAGLAVITLYALALELVQSKHKIPITPELIAETHTLTMQRYFKLFNITKAQIQQAIEAGQRGTPPESGAPSNGAAPAMASAPTAGRPMPPSPGATPGRM